MVLQNEDDQAAKKQKVEPQKSLWLVEDESLDVVEGPNELQMYRAAPAVPATKEAALQWWKDHHPKYPILARLARRYLLIPATSVPTERIWSDAGNIETPKRNRLGSDTLEALVFCYENRSFT